MSAITRIDVQLPEGASSARRAHGDTIVVEGKPSTFGTLLDVANPLQHIPGVSAGYRAVTGDKISDGAKLGGHVALGAMVAGPVGALAGAGLFLLERLFGGGRKAEAEAVAINLPDAQTAKHSAAQTAAQPPAMPATRKPDQSAARDTTTPLASPATDLSSAQFATLLASFGQAADAAPARENGDVAARMRANLDKYEAMQRAQR